jgi:hypothetical protein
MNFEAKNFEPSEEYYLAEKRKERKLLRKERKHSRLHSIRK